MSSGTDLGTMVAAEVGSAMLVTAGASVGVTSVVAVGASSGVGPTPLPPHAASNKAAGPNNMSHG